jgi:hypothetical protein
MLFVGAIPDSEQGADERIWDRLLTFISQYMACMRVLLQDRENCHRTFASRQGVSNHWQERPPAWQSPSIEACSIFNGNFI